MVIWVLVRWPSYHQYKRYWLFLADEILLSSDKTIAVIDGSGVLADPAGIDRQELIRLAKGRQPVKHFNRSKLSKDGYLVNIEDQDVKLPCMRLFLFCFLYSAQSGFVHSGWSCAGRHWLPQWSPFALQSWLVRSLWWTVSTTFYV